MTATETIRTAARLMRERAAEATPGPWFATGKSARYGGIVAAPTTEFPEHDGYDGHLIGESMSPANRDHVTGLHPTVALAVADLLDTYAEYDWSQWWDELPLAVARAYLGEV